MISKIIISSKQPPTMKHNPLLLPIMLLLVFASSSCNTSYQSQSLAYQTYRISEKQANDSALLTFLSPYSKNVNALMDGVIGYVEKELNSKRPESELGNFMADAFYYMAKEIYKTHIDVAFMNNGGIRLNQLPAGNITTGKIFELMPFDNLLILQKVKGNVLQEFLDLTASQGGWPVAGMTMQIKNLPSGQAGKKAIDVMIDGKKLDPEKIYTVVNSDYIANGGGDAVMLKSIPQIANGYLLRDALFDYIKWLKAQGKNITASIENRVTYAE